MRKENRPKDIKASGSGLFSFDEKVYVRLLEAAKEIRQYFDVPMISLDLAISNDKVVILEFRFLYYGIRTLEISPYYYIESNKNWEQIFEKSFLEDTFAYSVVFYIKSNS